LWHVWGRGEFHTGLCWGKLKEYHLEDLDVDWRVVLRGYWGIKMRTHALD